MNALEALGDGHAHAEQHRAFGRPVAGRATSVHLAREHRRRRVGGGVVLGGVVQRRYLTGSEVAGPAALASIGQLVLQLHVSEGAAHHHLVVAAAAAVGVEVGRSHAMGLQVLGRRHVRRDGTGRRDMIGRDEVAEVAEHAGALDGILARNLAGHAVEIGRAAHVGRVVVPSEGIARLGPQGLPRGVALKHVCGALLVQVGRHELVHKSGHLVGGGHDVGVEHGIALSVRAKGILLQIDVHGAGDGVGDDVGRLHQVVLRHVR